MALPESLGIFLVFLAGGFILGLAVSIMNCVAAASSEGAKALVSTTSARAASAPKASVREGGLEQEAPPVAAAAAAAAEAAGAGTTGTRHHRMTGKTRRAAVKASRNKTGSGSGIGGKALVWKASFKSRGDAGTVAAAAGGGSDGLCSAEQEEDEEKKKAVVDGLLGRLQCLASQGNGCKNLALETQNIARHLGTEATQKRFEKLGREIQGSLNKLDQHLVDDKRRACEGGRGGGAISLTAEQLERIETDTRMLHNMKSSLDMLRWWGASTTKKEGLRNIAPRFRNSDGGHRAAAATASASAAAEAGRATPTVTPDLTSSQKPPRFSPSCRTNPEARVAETCTRSSAGRSTHTKTDGTREAPVIAGTRARVGGKTKRRPSGTKAATTSVQGTAVFSKTTSVVSDPAAARVADTSGISPMVSLSGAAFHGSSVSCAPASGGSVVTGCPPAAAGAAAITTGAAGTPCRRSHHKSRGNEAARFRGESVFTRHCRGDGCDNCRRITNPAVPRSAAAAQPTTASIAVTVPAAPSSPPPEKRASPASEDFAPAPSGVGCFPPPLLARPAGGSGYSSRGGGGVLQEARACAPAQHLAVLRALLGGDEEEQRAAVAGSDSDSDVDSNSEGQAGGGRSGKAKGGVAVVERYGRVGGD